VKGIQVYSNEEPGPLLRGDNHKNVKMGWGHLKIFSKTTWPNLTRLNINHPWGKGFKFVQMKELPLSRVGVGDNSKE
jgi:hypothetical protein